MTNHQAEASFMQMRAWRHSHNLVAIMAMLVLNMLIAIVIDYVGKDMVATPEVDDSIERNVIIMTGQDFDTKGITEACEKLCSEHFDRGVILLKI